MRVGVVVGKFNTPVLSSAHCQLIKKMEAENDKLVIFVLDSFVKNADPNPIPYEIREFTVSAFCDRNVKKTVNINCLMERKYASVLANDIDEQLIFDFGFQHTFTLYQGPNSIPYQGMCNIEEVNFDVNFTHEAFRQQAYDLPNVLFPQIQGILHASQFKRPTVYNFVCLAIRKEQSVLTHIPKGFKKLCLPTCELSAADDSIEECGLSLSKLLLPKAVLDRPVHIASFRVDDWRLLNSTDAAYYHVVQLEYRAGDLPNEFKVYMPKFQADDFEEEFSEIVEFI